jgi:hypothetical protein
MSYINLHEGEINESEGARNEAIGGDIKPKTKKESHIEELEDLLEFFLDIPLGALFLLLRFAVFTIDESGKLIKKNLLDINPKQAASFILFDKDSKKIYLDDTHYGGGQQKTIQESIESTYGTGTTLEGCKEEEWDQLKEHLDETKHSAEKDIDKLSENDYPFDWSEEEEDREERAEEERKELKKKSHDISLDELALILSKIQFRMSTLVEKLEEIRQKEHQIYLQERKEFLDHIEFIKELIREEGKKEDILSKEIAKKNKLELP